MKNKLIKKLNQVKFLRQNKVFVLVAFTIIFSFLLGCASTGTYPVDIFPEMHYNQSYKANEPERLDIPKIVNQVELKTLLLEWPNDRKIIYCDEKIDHKKKIIKELLSFKDNNYKWAVLIGPEGGFSNKEQDLISKQKNVISVSLGDKLLRSDTAITVSLFCIQQLFDK